MSDHRDDDYGASLSRIMEPERKVGFERLNRAEFEARFVTPFRKKRFSVLNAYFAFGATMAVASALLVLNFFGHSLFRGQPMGLDKSLTVSRTGLWFGSRQIETRSVYPIHDRASTDFKTPGVVAWGKFAEIASANATLRLKEHTPARTSVEIISGKAVFRFAKASSVRELVLAGSHLLRITGTIVYVDASTQTLALIEGKTILDDRIPLNAGEEYDLKSGQKRKLTRETLSSARHLLPEIPLEEKTDNSPEAQLFRMYGNAYSVTLRSGQRILAAKVLKDGNLQIFTLGGPLYIAENEITGMTKLR